MDLNTDAAPAADAPPADHAATPTEPEPEPGRKDPAPEAPARWPPVALRAGRLALDVLPALAVYAAVRAAGLVALALLAGSQGIDPWPRLTSYDGMWLLGIARGGYDPLVPDASTGHPGLSNIAFLPLYPLLVRGLSWADGIPIMAAGLTVTVVGGLAAAAGLDRLGRKLAGGRRAGLALVVLWATWPNSIVLSMAYTEALFVALAVWSLVALLERRWLTAGVLGLLAGATRPFGVALAGAVALAAAVAIGRALLERRPSDAVRPLLAAVLTPAGLLAYWGWLWSWTGRPDAWLYVQSEQWRSRFDWGAHTLDVLGTVTTRPVTLVLLVVMLTLVVAVVLTVALAAGRAPLPIVAYTALAVALVVGDAGYDHVKARLLLAAFPLLLVPARALASLRVAPLAVVLAGLVAVSSWYNAYVLVLWYRSP